MRVKTLLTSLGLGAGLMYFLDPQYGNRRRALVRDRANGVVNSMDNFLGGASEDMRNRARGVLAEMSAKLSDQGAPDWILEERVRANLGRLAAHGRAVDVRADGGRIILSGPALRNEADLIVKTATRTRGVHGVENHLQVVDDPADIPALQGTVTKKGAIPEWQQENWSPAMRLLSGVGGSLLTLYSLRRRGLAKPILSTAGLVLATRGVTNLDPRSLLGLGMGDNAIKVHKTININAPIDEIYQFWRNFENFPLFMNHVKEVSTDQSGLSTWKVAGPAGSTIEFQSHITQDIPNEVIAWETVPDSQVHHAGFVRFDENWDGSTRVSVQLSYVPPAGALGHAVAQLFGVDPRQAMHEDLVRLKSLLEEGRTSTDEARVEYGERTSSY
jgi:uncharacterized membrane protein